MKSLWRQAVAPIGHLGEYLHYIRARAGSVVLITVLSIVGLVGPLAIPQLLRVIIDVAYPQRNMGLFWSLSALIAGLTVMLGGLAGVEQYLQKRMVLAIRSDLQRQLFRTLVRVKMARLDKMGPGPLAERISLDASEISGSLVGLVPSLCAIPGLVIGTVLQMGRINAVITVSVVVVLPLHACITMVGATILRKLNRRLRTHLERLRNVLDECFHGIEILKVFRWQRRKQYERYDDSIDDIVRQEMVIWRQGYLFSSLTGFLTRSWTMALTVFGMMLLFRDRLQLGEAMALGMYTAILLRPFNEIVSLYRGLMSASVAAERIGELRREEAEVTPAAGSPIEEHRGLIVRDVSFSYDSGRQALADISLRMNPGTTLAIIGNNGSGKTTLLKLLANYYSEYTGHISFEGQELRTYHPDEYAEEIAVVWGDNRLLHGTLRENCERDDDAGCRSVVEVATALGCDGWIRSLEKGYDTLLGDGGVRLSSGEIFKVSLIRALVKNPAVLLIDEFGSYWDSFADERLLQGLRRLRPSDGITVLVSHKKEVAFHPWVNQVVVLSNGRSAVMDRESGCRDAVLAGVGKELMNG